MLENKTDFRERFPFTETLMMFSGSREKRAISDSEELMSYLTGLCDITDKPRTQLLLPASHLRMLQNRGEVFMHSVEFCGYDFSEQSLPVNSVKKLSEEPIWGSTMTALWQPNFFRPSVRIGGEDVTSNVYNPTPDAVFHDLSIGYPLPFCFPINKVVNSTWNVEIYASYAQAFKDGSGLKYRNYALQAIITFWHNFE
jgi:hypothetical protein